MSKRPITVLTLLALTLASALIGQQHPPSTSGGHLGTWQLVSTKYGDAKEFSDYPQRRTAAHLA